MNAVVIAVLVMLILSLLRINVVVALAVGAVAGGLAGGLDVTTTVSTFTEGLGGNATVALSYALLGSFAIAISKTGLPDAMVDLAIKMVGKHGDSKRKTYSKVLIIFIILVISISSQNLVPVHIAFIPILIPPLLKVFNELEIDRRLIASVITFGLTAPYIALPVGFGEIFHGLLQQYMSESGLDVAKRDIPVAMLIPTVGMIIGLLIAIFISYRKPKQYKNIEIVNEKTSKSIYTKMSITFALIAVILTLSVQLTLSQVFNVDGMIFGALAGIAVLYFSGSLRINQADEVIT